MARSMYEITGPEGYIRSMFMTQGKIFFVRPAGGSDGYDGRTPKKALKTLTAALARCTENQNDRVYLLSEGSSASATTDYQTATLDWNKNGVDLIGISAGSPHSGRARVAWASTAASASNDPLFTLSASNCRIQGIALAVGSADANLSFGMNVTGDNNLVENVGIAFPLNDANDAAGAYALKIDGCDTTEFVNCTFGSFTVGMGTAANQLLLVDSGCSMVKFTDCDFIQRLESNTNSPAVRLADADAIGFGCLWFKRCNMIYTSVSGGFSQSGAFKVTAAQTVGASIVLSDCHTNAGKWDVDDLNMILNGNTGVPIDDNAGEMLAV